MLFSVTNLVESRGKVQMPFGHLGTMILVTSVVCEIRPKLVFLGIRVLTTAVLACGKNCI